MASKQRESLKMKKLDPGSTKAIKNEANNISKPDILLLRKIIKT
jgi:hypothetical protein